MSADIKHIKIISPDGLSETVFGEQVSESAYRLLENPVFNCRITYGTTVKVEADKDGELVVIKILRASDYTTRRFLLPSSLSNTNFADKIGNRIIEAGGTWEVVMGGLAFVHFPKTSTFNLNKLFEEIGCHLTELIDDEKADT